MIDSLDKILVTVLDVQDRVVRVEDDVAQIKKQQQTAFNTLDGFMHHLDRHETELTALRAADQRLERKMNTL